MLKKIRVVKFGVKVRTLWNGAWMLLRKVPASTVLEMRGFPSSFRRLMQLVIQKDCELARVETIKKNIISTIFCEDKEKMQNFVGTHWGVCLQIPISATICTDTYSIEFFMGYIQRKRNSLGEEVDDIINIITSAKKLGGNVEYVYTNGRTSTIFMEVFFSQEDKMNNWLAGALK